MLVQLRRIVLLLCIICLPGQAVFSQTYSSKNNYTGNWEAPASWNPLWALPQTNVIDKDITINGYITANDSLSFSGSCKLIIDDTLVIMGDLTINNNNDVQINNNGILIIRGNLTISDHTHITADGYIIITGNIIKLGPTYHGSFKSNDDPVKVFVGGTISPENLTDSNSDYPALDCSSPSTDPYFYSNCSHGNMTDILYDPIYSFFQHTCSTANASSNSPVCAGNTINFTSSGGIGYSWTGPNGFTSNTQNPSIPNATTAMAGIYTVIVTAAAGCTDTDTTIVTVNASPLVNITSTGNPMCINDLRTLTGSPAGGLFIVVDGPGTVSGNVLSATGIGNINLEYNYADVCANKATQSIIVNEYPVAYAGPDQELEFVFETQMKAELSSSETGEWSLITGSGNINDFHSPTTKVTELTTGENSFLWKVRNSTCEASAAVKITVYDLFIPSVITPNGDGRNDYFKISEIMDEVGLIIINRWGNMEYTNDNYINDWDGHNNNGVELPNDTYFYILRFKNGSTKKGSVLIQR